MDLWLAIVLIVVIAAACGGAAFLPASITEKRLRKRQLALRKRKPKNCKRSFENGGSQEERNYFRR